MLQNAVAQTTTTTGLGAYDLAALTGDTAPLFSTFVEAFGNGAIVPYRVEMAPDWEEGYGTVTAGSPDTLTRTVIRSSNSDSAVNWLTGTKLVIQHFPAEPLRFGAIGSVPTATGTANALAIAHVPPLRAIRPAMRGSFYAASANTGNVTLAIDGIPAVALKRAWGAQIGRGVIRPGALIHWYAHSTTDLRLAEDVGGASVIDRGSVSGASSLDLTFDAEFRAYSLTIWDLQTSAAATVNVNALVSGTPDTGASDYTFNFNSVNAGTVTGGQATTSGITITPTLASASPVGRLSAFITPGDGSGGFFSVASRYDGVDSTPALALTLYNGRRATSGAKTGLRLTPGSGNFTFSYTFEGVR